MVAPRTPIIGDASETRSQCRDWRSIACPGIAAVVAELLLTFASGQGLVFATANPDGAIGGLKVKFADVKGVKARYYEAGKGDPMVNAPGPEKSEV